MSEEFRQSMRRLAATVTVVTVAEAALRYGMTATAVTSLSFDPPSLLVCVNNSGSLYQPLTRAQWFCINVLHRSHRSVSEAFSRRISQESRFREGHWSADDNGVPFLNDAQANLFCRRARQIPFGTHDIIVGEVYKASFRDDVAPLVYCSGSYIESAIEQPLYEFA